MTSRERVRAALEYKRPDRIPAAFEAVGTVNQKLMKHYGYTDYDQLLERYNIDIVPVGARYVGPKLKQYKNEQGLDVHTSYWGAESTVHVTDIDTYGVTTYFPLNDVKTVADVDAAQYPSTDWFDYSSIKEQCDKHPDKAIIIGHEGPFQVVTDLIQMDRFFMLMIDAPEVAQRILDRMVAFELEHYKRMFEAGEGRVDILRTHDDYGTQISLLFSMDMWREFFKANTLRLVELAHSYGAFFQQHSCGAIAPVIPELIECGVDSLEPIQKTKGLEPEILAESYGGSIAFHGGIDTQALLPYGTPEEVTREVERFIRTLGKHGGYILMASQGFEGDVPIENIEAVYSANRY